MFNAISYSIIVKLATVAWAGKTIIFLCLDSTPWHNGGVKYRGTEIHDKSSTSTWEDIKSNQGHLQPGQRCTAEVSHQSTRQCHSSVCLDRGRGEVQFQYSTQYYLIGLRLKRQPFCVSWYCRGKTWLRSGGEPPSPLLRRASLITAHWAQSNMALHRDEAVEEEN